MLMTSCSSPNGPAPLSSNADAYFFQTDLTQVYTYSQDQASVVDTFTYKVGIVNNSLSSNSYLMLQRNDSSVLYYFKNEQTSDGTMECLLASSPVSNGFIALKGTLDLGASWYADAAQNVLATVVGKYAEYYLPGRMIHYNDVVVVKYSDKTAPSENYIVRYFARTYGLIFELTFSGPNSEITNLQLLSRQGASSNSNPDTHHDRWDNTNGRFEANMRINNLLDK